MKKFKNPFRSLSRFELALWGASSLLVILSYAFSRERDALNLAASLIGVCALIFVAKGQVFGQVLTVIFSLFYGIISFYFKYYGEMITYLFMSAPAAVFAIFSWLKNPYKGTSEVKVRKMRATDWVTVSLISLVTTAVFYFMLGYFGTENLTVSTFSVATSVFASILVYLRSPYYALAYSLNDIVLIVLWMLASVRDSSYLPMVACFFAFLANDLYGFYNWRKMHRRQTS
jgi:nicotinamide mononucleotide transporter PnuC